MVFTASTAKEFVVGAVYDRLGPDRTLTTPVHATTPVTGGAIAGDLVLVASGDPALGGRNAFQGRFDHMTNATAIDHVYADIAPNGARIGSPLAGLDNLARQIAGDGVTRVDGNVVIDTRLWETFVGGETALQVEESAGDPNTLIVRGRIAAKHSQLTIHRVQNGAEWARALFIEALQRAGIEVAATEADFVPEPQPPKEG